MAARCGRFLLIVVPSVVVLHLQQGCAEKPAPSRAEDLARADHPPISWQSPRMLKIQEEWNSLASQKTQSKSEYAKIIESLENVLKSNLSDADVRQLAASCDTVPAKEEDRSEFESAVLGYTVQTLVKAGDREQLVTLLSRRCPSRVRPRDCIEFELADAGARLKDPIVILSEAYSKCDVPEVRHDLAAALRRGFADKEIPGKGDSEFVENAARWYQREKERVVVNVKYPRNDEYCPLELHDRYPEGYRRFLSGPEYEPLFLRKTEGK
jgi:hypothetical protein